MRRRYPNIRSILVVLLLFIATGFTIGQEECLPEDILNPNKTWTEYIDAYVFKSIRLRFDSIPINQDGKTYFELLKSETESSDDWESNGLFRFEDNRLYYRSYFGTDLVWYDFNIIEGDTFFYENNELYKFIVVDFDTITFLDGSLRKRWMLKPADNHFWDPVIWIEGIGNTAGFDQNYVPWTADNAQYALVCASCHGSLIYDNPDFDTCWIVMTPTTELKTDELKIFPNPATDEISISGVYEPIKTVQIFDAIGGLVKVDTELQIQIADLPNGYYTAVVIRTDGSSVPLRFIKT